jgi:hypothetical protein
MLFYLIGILMRKEKGLVKRIELRKEDPFATALKKGILNSPRQKRIGNITTHVFKNLVVSSFSLPSSLSKDLHK